MRSKSGFRKIKQEKTKHIMPGYEKRKVAINGDHSQFRVAINPDRRNPITL